MPDLNYLPAPACLQAGHRERQTDGQTDRLTDRETD